MAYSAQKRGARDGPEAIGRRLRRNYAWISLIQLIACVGKVLIHPDPIGFIDEIFARVTIGPVPRQLLLPARLRFQSILAADVALRQVLAQVVQLGGWLLSPLNSNARLRADRSQAGYLLKTLNCNCVDQHERRRDGSERHSRKHNRYARVRRLLRVSTPIIDWG
jgi:Predicted integral membrane protein (DUF2270)